MWGVGKVRVFGRVAVVILFYSALSPAVNPPLDKTRLNLQLHTAAYKGDTIRILELLSEGAEINADVPQQNGKGYQNGDQLGGGTALMAAIAGEQPETVKLLLAKGANPNAVSSTGLRPVILAIQKRQPELLNLLLKKGAKLKPLSYDALVDACYSKEVMTLLLQKGIDPNTSEKGTGWTILMTCILEQPSAAEVLLAHGARASARDHFSRSPLLVAELDRIRLLTRDPKQRGLVEKDVQELDKIISTLLSHGADKKDLLTADFLQAATGGDLSRVKHLAARGASLNAYDFLYSLFHRGATALMLATQQGHADVVQYLLSAGASPKLKDTDGNGVFFYANHGLLKDPKHKSKTLEIVKKLIAAGANRYEDVGNEAQVLDQAHWLDTDIVNLLKNAGGRPNPGQASRAE
jgi:uncharacterized protein